MRYGSVCSGIEAATVAWHPLGWKPSFFSEIEAFPRAVLAHHYPHVPLHGDFTTIKADEYDAIDLLVGGTPCQSFSVAGLRGGLADERGNLALEYLRLADRTRPRWLVWENVPGVLSSNGGRDFGAILGGMVELGYGFAYRVLDAQHFGVPQRRRRVFVVGYLGDWRPAAAVLFERHSLQGHSAPSREKGQSVAGTIARLSFSGGAGGRPEGAAAGHFVASTGNVAHCLNAGGMGRIDYETETMIAHAIQAGALRENPNSGPDGVGVQEGIAYTLEARAEVQAVAFDTYNQTVSDTTQTLCSRGDTLGGNAHLIPAILQHAVRRLTPRECERLQGFPDDYTLIPHRGKPAADGPRYKALGNSMAVPVMRWIGERIQQVEELTRPILQAAE